MEREEDSDDTLVRLQKYNGFDCLIKRGGSFYFFAGSYRGRKGVYSSTLVLQHENAGHPGGFIRSLSSSPYRVVDFSPRYGAWR